MKRILILCTGNSCRSQMAEGFFKYFAEDKAEVYSAGIEAHGLNLKAVEVMKEAGIDISKNESKTLDKFINQEFDLVITVCDNAQETCPIFPNAKKKLHYNFSDPAKATGTDEEIMKQFREVRDQIRDYAKEVLKQENIT